jgi:hypothetical protein
MCIYICDTLLQLVVISVRCNQVPKGGDKRNTREPRCQKCGREVHENEKPLKCGMYIVQRLHFSCDRFKE